VNNVDTEKPQKSRQVTTDRLVTFLQFDRELLAAPRKLTVQALAGTDEVGRGCLAGPVVAAAVIMPPIDISSELALRLARLNDSKQVLPHHRTELAAVLRSVCQFAIAEASVEEIDELNIHNASLLAMRRAVRRLKLAQPCVLAVDGNKRITSLRMEQVTIVDGDTKSAAIAAASIIAKVHRDAFMTKLARKFPGYHWDSNKGYRSRDHWKAIDELGMTRWHRKTFVEKWLKAADDGTLSALELETTAELEQVL
jgi:ribonuclease HII